MIPASFGYERVDTFEGAVAALVEHGEDAKLLAGGHSLIPLMKLRLAAPSVLVDIGRIAGADSVRDAGDHLVIGALTRHCDVERSALVRAGLPLLSSVAAMVGDPQVRHRGTIGGSIAHGDPASDLPAVLLAAGATLVLLGPGGTREVAADDFFVGFLETALAPDEVLVEIRVPKAPDAGWSYQKFNRRAQDWAIVAVAALRNGETRVGLVNMGPTPMRAVAVEAAVAGGSSAVEAALLAAEGTEPTSDLNASADYRGHLARVLTRRALVEAGA